MDEDDPLDLYMMGIDQQVKDDKPSGRKPKPGIELDEDDNVADFLQVTMTFNSRKGTGALLIWRHP